MFKAQNIGRSVVIFWIEFIFALNAISHPCTYETTKLAINPLELHIVTLIVQKNSP